MLGAGADPDTFLRTLRAYVLQHSTTTEQVSELLRDLAAVNPPAFKEALAGLGDLQLLADPAAVVTSLKVHKAKSPKAHEPKLKRPAKRTKSLAARHVSS